MAQSMQSVHGSQTFVAKTRSLRDKLNEGGIYLGSSFHWFYFLVHCFWFVAKKGTHSREYRVEEAAHLRVAWEQKWLKGVRAKEHLRECAFAVTPVPKSIQALVL